FCDSALPEAAVLQQLSALQEDPVGVKAVLVLAPALAHREPPPLAWVVDHQMTLARRYDAVQGACYLIRPDQHIAARWRDVDVPRIRAALKRATGSSSKEAS